MAEEEKAVNTVGASNPKGGGKTVIIAFDGSDYAKYAMKCELCLISWLPLIFVFLHFL